MNPIRIGRKKQLFWDDYLVNTSLSSAERIQHHPAEKEVALVFDKPWEGDGCDFLCPVEADGIYRIYYMAWEMFDKNMTVHTTQDIRVCVIESKDGLHWERPNLRICEFDGSFDNNIIYDNRDGALDNFSVFCDGNPACPPDERFKATVKLKYELWCFTSADGYHFKKDRLITDKGRFDTMNVAFWSEALGKYFCFIRDFHDYASREWPALNEGVRDIRVLTSPDFRTWTDPVLLDFGGAEDIPLYTSAAFPYPGAKEVLIGLPSRYVERKTWNDNFAQLTGAEARKKRMNVSPRYGLATTDCVVMISRDGFTWDRQDEAFMTPGIERDDNWVYGDCYPTPGLILTASDLPGAPPEYSFYCDERHWSQKPAYLQRYVIRQDGFLSYHAGRAPKTVVTKPLLYEGGTLSINFATSALGYVYVTMADKMHTFKSCELFGDSLDRRVRFDGDTSELIGKEVVLTFTMSDADIYSMQFT